MAINWDSVMERAKTNDQTQYQAMKTDFLTLHRAVQGRVEQERSKQRPTVAKNIAPVKSEPSVGKLLQGIVYKGNDQAATALTSTADFLLGRPIAAVGEKLGQDWSNNPISAFNRHMQELKDYNEDYFSGNTAALGKAGEVADWLGTGTVAAIPQAVAAFATGGTSAAASGTAALQTASGAAASSGLGSAIANAAGAMSKNPQYWLSVLQSLGNSYDAAKADGAGELKANLYAIANGLTSAMVEVGGVTGHGGIQDMPAQLAQGGSALRQWISSMVDEGKEEVVQGVLERGLQNVLYQKENPIASASDPNAILNPATAAREFTGGAVVGGILGGGQILAGQAIQAAGRHANANGMAGGAGRSSADAQQTADPLLRAVQNGGRLDTREVQQKSAPMVEAEQINYNPIEAATIRKETATFKNIIAGLDTSVSAFFNKWQNGRKSHQGDKLEKLYLGKTTPAVQQQISDILGYAVSDRNFILTNDDIKHIWDRHGDADAEIRKGNLPLENWVFDALPMIVKNPDTIQPGGVEKGGNRQGLVFGKEFPGGKVVYVQFDNSARGTIQGRTLYVKEKGSSPSVVNTDESVNTFTPKTAEPELPVNSIPDSGENVNNANDSLGSAQAGFDPYSALQNQSDEFHPAGANTARPVDVPLYDAEGQPISRAASNLLGAKAIPDAAIPILEQMVAQGDLSYRRNTDGGALERAERTIREKEFSGALEEFRAAARTGRVSKDITVLGQRLLNNAANAGDGNALAEIAVLMQNMTTNAAQATQAMSLLRKLSPESQLYGIQKMVNDLNETLEETGRAKPKSPAPHPSTPGTAPSPGKGAFDGTGTGASGRGQRGGGRRGGENVPVEEWMQRTGELLAERLGRSGLSKQAARTVSQTILSDLHRFAQAEVPTERKSVTPRSDMDRLQDLFSNYDHYQEAWEAAKQSAVEQYGNSAEIMGTLDQWMQRTVADSAFSQVSGHSGIEIDPDLLQKFMAQTDQNGRDAVLQEIYQNVADQVPSNWRDKWNAWRYLSMLGNPRTHVRNVVGNAVFQIPRFIKNEIAAGLETALSAAGVDVERTKSFGVSPTLYRAAWNDYKNVAEALSGNKYSDIKGEIESRRHIFQTKALESARIGNSNALEFEDAVFKRLTYADALAGYLKAHGVTAAQLSEYTADAALLNRARDYAGKEAQKATFNDRNLFSDKTVEIVRAMGTFGEAVLPFKRTPANILARGMEYSPAGLVKSLTYDLAQVKRGNMTVSEALDHMAAGLTGTGLALAGAYLFARGLVTPASGDEPEDKWEKLLGHQGYALELPDGTSVTLDWLAPAALPFFMGVETMSSMGENGFSMNDLALLPEIFKNAAQPMLDLSMLQGVNDLIDSVSYEDSSNKIGGIIGSALVSYFSQAIPTLGGQLERTYEDRRMMTYTDKNSAVPSDIQYALGRASAKIPGVDYQQIPYIDAWGQQEKTGDKLLNLMQQTVNPAYLSKVSIDAVEKKLQRIADATGDTSVFPQNAPRYFPVNGERVDLTKDEYVQFATTMGKTSYDTVKALADRTAFQALDATTQAALIGDAYEYAAAVAKQAVSAYEPEGWVKKAIGSGVPVPDYLLMRSFVDVNGNGSVTQDEAQAYLDGVGLSRSQKSALWRSINSGWKRNPYQ